MKSTMRVARPRSSCGTVLGRAWRSAGSNIGSSAIVSSRDGADLEHALLILDRDVGEPVESFEVIRVDVADLRIPLLEGAAQWAAFEARRLLA